MVTLKQRGWIHTLLKATVYNVLDNTLMTIRYTMQDEWYQKPSDCQSPTLRKLWNMYLLGWKRIDKKEGRIGQNTKMGKFMDQCVGIVCTVIDDDPAWHDRINIWYNVIIENYNNKHMEDVNYDIAKQN